MYIVVMQKDKSLLATVTTTLYQHENLVDKVFFLFPQNYNGLELSDCTAVIKYLDQGNVPHTEALQKSEELYKDHLQYFLPIDSSLTKFAGDVKVRITFSKTDVAENKQYVLNTGEITISIAPLSDYYAFVPDESLEIVDQLIGKLDAKIAATEAIAEIYDKKKADNLSYEDDKLQLLSNGEKIGNAITIVGGDSPSPGGGTEIEIVEF